MLLVVGRKVILCGHMTYSHGHVIYTDGEHEVYVFDQFYGSRLQSHETRPHHVTSRVINVLEIRTNMVAMVSSSFDNTAHQDIFVKLKF